MKSKAIRRLAFCLAGFWLLSGCTYGTVKPLQPLQITEAIPPRELVFQVSDQYNAEVVRQADLFADRVYRLSNGLLTVRVLAQVPDFELLAAGDCDLALLRNIQLAQAVPAFSTFSLPFLYGGQKHMSAVLNSDEMLSRLRGKLQKSGVTPLAAVYYGSTTLVSDRTVAQMPTDFAQRMIALRTNNTDKLIAFEALGARVLPYQQDSLAELLGVEVEILPEDLQKPSDIVKIDTIEVSLLQALDIPDDSRPLYIMEPGHSITPLWLVANQEMWQSLSDTERAILSEAQAGLVAGIDRFFVARELNAVAMLAEKGATFMSMERELLVDLIYYRGDRYQLPDYFDRKLYNLVQSYS